MTLSGQSLSDAHPYALWTAVVLILLACVHQAEAQLTIPRGRPQLNAARTTFVADNGQRLRGPYTSTEWTSAAPLSEIAKIKDLGCNAVHLYAEVFDPDYPDAGSTAPGYNMAEVDKIVQRTRDLWLYLVMTIGNGANNGNHNRQWAVDFWNLYSARYANETHVIFEVHNEPMAWGPSYLTGTTPAGTLDMEMAAYQAIRTNAPQTPVLLFTYAVLSGTGGANAALTDIHAFNQAVFGNPNAVWTNEAVGFHGYGGWDGTATAVSNLLSAGYPCFMTEFGWPDWGTSSGVSLEIELTTDLERLGVSWLTFQYIPPSGVSSPVTDAQLFKDRVDAAGLSWTPDYGTWPLARGVFGNGGQPRATVANWVSSFLTGTLRIQAEDFDAGGEGVACHDTDAANSGGQYRTNEPVDIATCNDTGGGFKVTSTADGEWMEYTILVREPGYYDVALRYATPASHGAVEFVSNVDDSAGWRSLSSTGSLTNWATATVQVYLEFGRQKLRLRIPRGGFDANWIELSPAATGIIPNGTYKFLNAGSALAMEALTNDAVAASPYAGAGVHQWNVQHRGGGQYQITSAANGRSWNIANDALQLVSAWSTGNERCFIPLPGVGGFHRFIQVGSGLSLNAAATNSAPVQQQEFSGGGSQQWAILAPSSPAFPIGLTATALSSTQVALAWTAVPGASSYRIKRSADRGGPYTTVATGLAGTNGLDTVNAGARYYYVVSAVAGSLEGPNSVEARVDPPHPWIAADIGSTGLPGSAAFDAGVFGVEGSGADIWGTSDAFRFVYLPVSGNFTITARVLGVENTDAWAKAGVMIREGMNANSRNAFVAVTPGNGVTWQYRASTGGTTGNSNTTGLSAPCWVRMVRSGNTFTAYRSPDGVTWTQQGSPQTVSMAADVYAGLAVTSHDNTKLCTATFDSVSAPGWANPAPPAAPASLSANATNRSVALSWPASTNATSYHVRRATTAGGPYTFLINVAATNCSDANLQNNVAYYYVVSAVNVAGEGASSPEAAAPGQMVAPAGLSVSVASVWQAGLAWSAFPGASSYNVKRSTTGGGPYATVATGVTGTAFTDSGVNFLVDPGYYYVLSAIVSGSETVNGPEASTSLAPLTGAIIGTPGSYNNAGDTIAKVFDGNFATFFDGPNSSNGNGCWVGRDFGAGVANVVRQIRYCPRTAFPDRMVGGVFQGANLADFSDAVTLATVPTAPPTGQFTAVNATSNAAFRYVRYLSPNGGWGNIAELEFYGFLASVPVPTGFAAAADDAQVSLTWTATAGVTGYKISRATTSGGSYTPLATTAATNLLDTGVTNGSTYYYVIAGLNTGLESPASSPVSARPSAPITAGELRVVIALAGGNTDLTVHSSVVGHTYQLQYCDDLTSGNWQNYGPGVTGSGGSITLSMPMNGQRRFFRILVQR